MAEKRPKGDRGGGIHITRRSDFRLRDIRLSFDATTGDLADSSMTPELRTDIFDDWLRIAEQASNDSEDARRPRWRCRRATMPGSGRCCVSSRRR